MKVQKFSFEMKLFLCYSGRRYTTGHAGEQDYFRADSENDGECFSMSLFGGFLP